MSFDADAVAKAEALRLTTFTSQVAFDLGDKLRDYIRFKYPGQGAIIDIRTANEQQLFFATTDEGTLPDNAHWAKRKRNAVLRWGKSTASLNLKGWGKDGIPAHYGAHNPDYACHGGGFPLRVKGVETLVGVAVVSGLKQEEDHQVIVDVLTELIAEQEASK